MDMLGPAHRALIKQFPVDQDVLKAAADLSREFMSQCDTIEHILDPLSRNEMKALLERVAAGDGMKVMAELNNQSFYRGDDSCQKRMACDDFATQVLDIRGVRVNKETEARARKKRKKEAAHRLHLKSVMQRADAIWSEIDKLMEQKISKAYDEAAKKMIDLHDASKQEKKEAEFNRRLIAFKAKYSRRAAMMRRISKM